MAKLSLSDIHNTGSVLEQNSDPDFYDYTELTVYSLAKGEKMADWSWRSAIPAIIALWLRILP